MKSKRDELFIFSYNGIFVICDFKQVVFHLFQGYLHFTCPLSLGASDLDFHSLQIFFEQMSRIAAISLLTMVAMVVEVIGDLPPHQVGSSSHQGGHQQKYADGGGYDLNDLLIKQARQTKPEIEMIASKNSNRGN